jgi:hypothetical protein
VRVPSRGRNVALHVRTARRTRRHAARSARAVHTTADGVVGRSHAAFLAESLAGLQLRLLAPSVLGFAGVGVDGGVETRGAGRVGVVCVCRFGGLLRGCGFGVAGAEGAAAVLGLAGERVGGYGAATFVDGIAG